MRNSKGLRETLATINAQPAFINAYLKRFKTSLKGGSHHCAVYSVGHSIAASKEGEACVSYVKTWQQQCTVFILFYMLEACLDGNTPSDAGERVHANASETASRLTHGDS